MIVVENVRQSVALLLKLGQVRNNLLACHGDVFERQFLMLLVGHFDGFFERSLSVCQEPARR